MTTKVAEVAPAGTVTVAGTEATVLDETRVIVDPPVGAIAESLTVPVAVPVPVMTAGLIVKLVSTGGLTVRFADCVTPLDVAEMVAPVAVDTAVVVTVKVAVFAPAAMVTEVGTVALVELDASEMARPPVGAAVPMVTVPVEDAVPTTLVGDKVTLTSAGGLIVNVADCDELLAVPVMVADVTVATDLVVTVKVVEVAPAATVTDAGTTALALLEARLTTTPDGPAGPLRVIVPVDDVRPVTAAGLKDTLETTGAFIVRVAV